MTKQVKNIYSKIYDFENLYTAYLNARKNKRYRSDVLKFSDNLEENLIELQNELIWHKYQVGQYREFYVKEPKKRLIMALPFKDRVIQWAIYQVLNNVFEKGYIDDSYACRINKGTHKAVQRLSYWLHKIDRKPCKFYYLKMDISKYFYRIDHDVLMNILSRKISDNDVLWLLKTIIKGDDRFGLPLNSSLDEAYIREEGRGMPIGNLTSQMFANLYLNELDQFVKRTLKIKHYIRYMDDVIILYNDKQKLHEIKNSIKDYLKNNLKLNLNNKTAIRPISLGIEFVGYKLWPTHIKIRKSTALKMKRRLKNAKNLYGKGKMEFSKVNATVQSYLGMLKYCNSYNFQDKIFKNFILKRENVSDK